jgi:hypothetical protein
LDVSVTRFFNNNWRGIDELAWSSLPANAIAGSKLKALRQITVLISFFIDKVSKKVGY